MTATLCDVQPLDTRDPGDDSELTCAPVVGIKVADYDCCSTEAWIVVGLTLGGDSFTVELIEAHHTSYHLPHEWYAEDSIEVPTIADAIAAADIYAHDYWLGRRCTCP